jgi:hypothetical protein
MRIPRLVWDRRHNVAALSVSYAARIWDTHEVGDVLLAYGASGRLVRIVFLDARVQLPRDATASIAVATALRLLAGSLPDRDVEVLRSAATRAA